MSNDFQNFPPPYSAATPQPAAPQRSGSNRLAMGCGIASVLGVLVCCGGFVALMYSFGELMSAEIEMELRDNPQIQQHIGQIEDLSMDFAKSAAIEGDDVYVYTVEGDKGSGELTVESITNFEGTEEVVDASLRLPDGQVIELDLEL